MQELVKLKGNDVFTDSLVISRGTGVAHRKLKETIRKYQKVMEQFGKLPAPRQAESTGGRFYQRTYRYGGSKQRRFPA